jgi:hypothetical protein
MRAAADRVVLKTMTLREFIPDDDRFPGRDTTFGRGAGLL